MTSTDTIETTDTMTDEAEPTNTDDVTDTDAAEDAAEDANGADNNGDSDDDEARPHRGTMEMLPHSPGFGRRKSMAPENPDYHGRNTAMFKVRDKLKDTMAKLAAKDELTVRERALYTRTKLEFEKVTERIVDLNMPLVMSYVRRFTARNTRDDFDDFVSAGIVGLMRAVDSYDHTRGSFASWAYRPIKREVLGSVRDADHPNLTHGDFERRPAILRARNKLQDGDPDYQPDEEAIAIEAGVPLKQVVRVLRAPRLNSLHAKVGDDDSDGELGDFIEDPDVSIDEQVMGAMSISALEQYGLSALDERELYVLVRRFGLDGEPTQRLSSIGEVLDLSREAVRQIEAKAVSKLAHPVLLRRLVRQNT